MKVIIIKDCKDGKANQIIDVSDGYATNFLIKKGFALPVNNKTQKIMEDKIKANQEREAFLRDEAIKLQGIIENIQPVFFLKETNMVVHGSITRKQIHNALKENNIKVDTFAIDNVKISSLGISKVKITLYKDIVALLKVEVKADGK